ncbi:Protein of uncharacterised function (DUF3644) [Urinicoccus massiliensis]|uniref:Protein of uncharacterized function (DUF3644) n=1 Tax=Urinicoccus massiliensis TaxID=1723382 RepID=A0A8H2MAF0_9FIRM|nr:DUF3644 domain-containing protein [Urinicoccus massiliensis]VFB17235.1 Protein of uncharacterised function (DUF3644) [Urinicoccus massiliensis]
MSIKNNLKNQLIEKSVEAFIMGLEIYNKPTIKYRIEGFSFFICNAWELMLKAELINKNESLYYKDHPERTLSLNETVNKIYTDKNTRIRLNLEKIIDLRNISTHFITQDYELKYAPLFQACVLNFIHEINRFHKIDITKYVAQNFLTISATIEPLSNEEIKIKYPAEIAERFIKQANEIDVLTEEYNSDKFSINIKQMLYITKKKDEADFSIRIDKSAINAGNIIKELKDPADTHKYAHGLVITAVQERLKKKNITIGYKQGFNSYVLNLFINFYNIKSNPKYTYCHIVGNNKSYTYSQSCVEFIVKEIEKDPLNIVESLKLGINKKR